MQIRSVLKPEGSIMAGIAVAGSVWALYSLAAGPISQAHATDPNHPSLESARRKAGYTAFVFVSAMSLITRDGNVAVLGYGSIVAMEFAYRHAIMAEPTTGKMVTPAPDAYQPAGGLTAVPDETPAYDASGAGY